MQIHRTSVLLSRRRPNPAPSPQGEARAPREAVTLSPRVQGGGHTWVQGLGLRSRFPSPRVHLPHHLDLPQLKALVLSRELPPRLCDTSPSPSPCPGAPGCVHKYPTSQGPSSTCLWACPRPPHPYPPRSQLCHVREPASAQPGTPRQTPARDSHGLSSCGPRVSPSKSRLTASRTTTLLGGASPSAGGMGPAPRGCFPGPTSLREAVWG